MTRPVFPVFAAEGKNTIFLLRLSELIFSRRSAFFTAFCLTLVYQWKGG